MKKKSVFFSILTFLFFAASVNCYAQEKYDVYFYGVITPPSQESQKNITLDLFSAQIRSFPEINFIDKRLSGFDVNYSKLTDKEADRIDSTSIFNLVPASQEHSDGSRSIILVSKIEKTEDEEWICNIYTKNLYTSKIDFVKKSFESYYKVLTDSKSLFNEILSVSADVKVNSNSSVKKTGSDQVMTTSMSIEGLSGTWAGEKGITKIVIMRSGRGFVIFNNGASMNISISVEDSKTLKITQAMPFNASFYPDIPRQKILEYSKKAKPIEWTFSLSGNGTLSGTKETLILDESSSVIPATINVSWNKIN